MKNILFAAFVVVAANLVSCGYSNKASETADSSAVDTTLVDSVDTVSSDTVVAGSVAK